MTLKAILLPLDGVLLANSSATYERTCRQMEADYADEAMARAARTAVAEMFDPQRSPTLSNHALLQSAMQRELAIAPVELERIAANFYSQSIPRLQEHSVLADAVPDLITTLEGKGILRSLLTDVCFAEAAARQRLSWAGMTLEDWDFVAHAENTHFAAGSPALYAEIVARLGVEPDEALFVAECGAGQLEPARVAGLHTYPVIASNHEQGTPCASCGTLAELVAQLGVGWPANLPPPPITSEQVIAELRGNLGALYGTLAEVGPEQWFFQPAVGDWSIAQILSHLLEREGNEQLPRLRRILGEEAPFIAAPPPAAPPATDPHARDGWLIAEQFTVARQETLALLTCLAVEDWLRPARHSIFGPTNLLEMAHFTAQHDRLHLNQICQTLGKCD